MFLFLCMTPTAILEVPYCLIEHYLNTINLCCNKSKKKKKHMTIEQQNSEINQTQANETRNTSS